MISASFPLPVFMKKCFFDPFSSVVVILEVDADEQPPPPAEDTVVFDGSKDRTSMTAGSSFMAITKGI